MGRRRFTTGIVVGIFVISTLFFVNPMQLNTVEAAVSHGLAPIGPGNNTTSEDTAGAPYDSGPSGDSEVIWSPLFNPHYIEGNYTVESMWTLTIEPGCDIRFQPGARLIVHGGLTADGGIAGITFTSNQTIKNPGDWDGIYVEGMGSFLTMNKCNIEYAIVGTHVSNWGMIGGISNSEIHHTSIYGVYLDFVMGGPMINDTQIYDNPFGVYTLSSTLQLMDNEIYNNNNGVYMGVAPGNFPMGASLMRNNITYNIENGVVIAGVDGNIWENYISFNGRHGIYAYEDPLTDPWESWIQDNKIENNTEAGIRQDGMNSSIRQCSISNGTYGIYSNSSRIFVYDSMIQGWSDKGIVSLGVNKSTVWVENSTMSSVSGSSFFLDDDSHIGTQNTTFDKSKVNIQDAFSNLTVHWWVQIKVNESDGDPAQGATVWLNNTFGDIIHSHTTDDQGWIYWVNVTEYIDGFGAIDFDTHIASAINGSESGMTFADIDSYTIIYIDLGVIKDFQVPLIPGWNMISFPLNQSDTTLGAVLGTIDGNYKAVQWFNATDSADHWKHNFVGKPFGNDLFDIHQRMGMWIYMYSSDTLLVQGDLLTTTDTPLYTGWNFVGYPSLTTRTVADSLSSISGQYDAVWYYNASDSADHWKSDNDGDLTEMKAGEGYFIHATQDTTWTLDGI
jgi:hypothetical protein